MIPDALIEHQASLFSVLGDKTRLTLVTSLANGERRSITELSTQFSVSRQAVTKHLRLLEKVGIVAGEKSGRENRYKLKVESLQEVKAMIEDIEAQWDDALGRLKHFVED